jgi:hypothetical protein
MTKRTSAKYTYTFLDFPLGDTDDNAKAFVPAPVLGLDPETDGGVQVTGVVAERAAQKHTTFAHCFLLITTMRKPRYQNRYSGTIQ